jgi:hypothetical protein
MSSQQYFISYPLEAIGYFLYGVTLILYLLKVQKDLRFQILFIYFLIGLSILLRILTVTGGNNFYYSLLYAVNSLGWGAYFYLVLHGKLIKGIAVFAVLTTISYFIIRNILFIPEKVFDSIGYVISSTGTVLLVFVYFYQLLSNVKTDPLSLNFDFWLSCSQLIYNLGAFGIFLTFNHFTLKILNTEYYNKENRQILASLWGVHNVLLFLASLLTWVGVLWIVYRRKSPSS